MIIIALLAANCFFPKSYKNLAFSTSCPLCSTVFEPFPLGSERKIVWIKLTIKTVNMKDKALRGLWRVHDTLLLLLIKSKPISQFLEILIKEVNVYIYNQGFDIDTPYFNIDTPFFVSIR